MALMNRWEVSNFLDSRKGRDWIPDFVGECFDFGGLSTAVNMDNGLGKSSVTEAVLWMLSRDRELGRKTRPRLAPDGDGRFSHIRCEFIEPDDIDLFTHGERLSGETWVFGYYGNRGEDYFYSYPGRLEDCPVHLDETESDGGGVKVCIPDDEFRAALSRFKTAVAGSARDWSVRVRQMMSGAQLDQLVAYQKRGGGDKAATFYDVKVGRGEGFDEAFFRQYVAPEILVGVGDFDDEADARGFDRKIVAQAQSVIDAKIQVRAKAEVIGRAESTLAALRSVDQAAGAVLAAGRQFALQAEATTLAVSAVRTLVEAWGVAGLPIDPDAAGDDGTRAALLHGGVEIGGGMVVSHDWLDGQSIPLPKRPGLRIIENGIVRVLPLSAQSLVPRGRGPGRYARVAEILDHLDRAEATPDRDERIGRVTALARCLCRLAEVGPRRLATAAAATAAHAEAALRRCEEERSALHGEQSGLIDRLTKFEVNEAAYGKMRASGRFDPAELAAPLATLARIETARTHARAAIEAHTRRTIELEQARTHLDAVTAEFGDAQPPDVILAGLTAAAEAAGTAREAAVRDYAAAKRDLDRLRQDDDTARHALAEARLALDALARDAAEIDVFYQRFGLDADPARQAARLIEQRDAAQAEEAARDGEARSAAAHEGELDRTQNDLTARSRDLGERIAGLETLEPSWRAFAAAHPGRDTARFLAEQAERRRDAQARIEAARHRHDQAAPLVRALDGFETAYPGRQPAEWLAEAANRRGEASVAIAEANRRIAKAMADLDRLAAARAAPTETEEDAAALIADLPHRPLHAALTGAGPAAARRADLLDHFSALLFAPVFATAAAAAEAADRLGRAGLPVPVLIEADLAAWIAGDGRLTRRDSAHGPLVTGLFAGLRTPASAAIQDPEARDRRQDEIRARLAALTEHLAEWQRIAADLAPEGESCRLARAAAEAIAHSARARLAEADAEARAAGDELAAVETTLTPESKALADTAHRFQLLGGETALGDLRAEAAGLARTLGRVGERLAAARDHTRRANDALATARQQARAAEADAAQWLEWCDRAAAFGRAGGAAELERRREALVRADTACDQVAIRIAAATIECDRLEDLRTEAETASRNDEARLNRWRDTLRRAAQFAQSGAETELERSATTLAALKRSEDEAEARLRFDFEAAEHFVRGGGSEAMEPAKLRYETIKARLDRIERIDLPEARHHHDHARQWQAATRSAMAAAEQHLAGILAAYQKVRDGNFDTILPEDGPGLHPIRTIAARLTETALSGLAADDHDGLDRMVADYAALADGIAGFDLDRLRDGMKDAIARRQSARDQFDAAIRRETDPNRPLDAAIRHQLDGARDRPDEIATLLATVENSLTWERSLHAKAQDGLTIVQDELVSILRGIAGNADVNLRRLKKVLAGGQGARIHLNVEVADDQRIGAVLTRTVEDIETERTRFHEDQSKGRPVTEEQFAARLTGSVRDTVYRRMFVKGNESDPLIAIEHPTMREGRPFRFEKDGISGGQATALTLLWTIKLAEFSVLRETASLSAAARRRGRVAQHSIVIVDGLFSDLSKQDLIDESMEAMLGIKGAFQLIGLIHSPYYRNNWDRFPTLIIGRKVASIDDQGRKSEAVAILGQRRVRGRVMALSYGAAHDDGPRENG